MLSLSLSLRVLWRQYTGAVRKKEHTSFASSCCRNCVIEDTTFHERSVKNACSDRRKKPQKNRLVLFNFCGQSSKLSIPPVTQFVDRQSEYARRRNKASTPAMQSLHPRLFTARRYASAVYAVVVCRCVCLSHSGRRAARRAACGRIISRHASQY